MKRWMSRCLTTCLAFCFAGLVLQGSRAWAAEEAPKYGGTLIVGLGSDPATLNPDTTNNFYAKQVSSTVYNNLVNIDFDMNPVPELAKSWEVSADGKTYTIHLVSTAWHDGKPFTSEDVKFSFEEILMKLHPGGNLWKEVIKEIRTPNPLTVVFELNTTFPPFFYKNAYDSYILPKHLFQGADVLKNPSSMKPIGTGPFKFVEWVKGSHIRVERNTNYFNPKLPYLDGVVFKIVPDVNSRMTAFERGELDYLSEYVLPSSEVVRFKNKAGFEYTGRGHEVLGGILKLFCNLDQPPLNSLPVRKAIAHSINRQYILDKADYGLGKVATGPISSALAWAYTSDVPKYPYNVETATKLLDEAGYPRKADGTRFRLVIRYDRGVALFAKTAEILREQLRQVGIDLELSPGDLASTLDIVFKQRKFDLFIWGAPSAGDPAINLSRMYSPDNIRPIPYTNASGYKNQTVGSLLEKGATLVDRRERAKAYHQLQKILVTDLPVIDVIEYGQHSAWRTEFKGLHRWSAASFYTLEDVWWIKGKAK
jgi:peptide/nickel transport system substrate-binding protein